MPYIARFLAFIPRNMTIPVIAILAGWYGGAKYGAPDWVMNSIDDMVSRSAAAISSFMGGDEEEAPEDNGAEDNGTEV